MDTEILHDFSPFLRIHKDGTIERLLGTAVTPPSLDPVTKVESKDVVYSPEHKLSCRLYKPQNVTNKLPLVVYFHGGGFLVETASSPTYHNYLNKLVSEANVIAVSVDYRRAPEDPIPAAYDDSWAALKWIASSNDEWLTSYVDFDKVFLAGDSAGGNIVYNMGMRLGREEEESETFKVYGLILVHPFFWGNQPVGDEITDEKTRKMIEGIWLLAYPDAKNGNDDLLINPIIDPDLKKLVPAKVCVFVAEKDSLTPRGKVYCEKLVESGWGGVVEVVETKDEEHVFHLFKPTCENAGLMMKNMVSFINQAKET
ncbi:hypothetical protein ACFE04_001623 [Oxalis oulophora]